MERAGGSHENLNERLVSSSEQLWGFILPSKGGVEEARWRLQQPGERRELFVNESAEDGWNTKQPQHHIPIHEAEEAKAEEEGKEKRRRKRK